MQPGKEHSSAFLTALLCLVGLMMVACGGGGTTTTSAATHAKASASQQVFIEGYTGRAYRILAIWTPRTCRR